MNADGDLEVVESRFICPRNVQDAGAPRRDAPRHFNQGTAWPPYGDAAEPGPDSTLPDALGELGPPKLP
jgi:hypothetical protein